MLYPLRFEPILRRYLWGGRRLGSQLGKSLEDHDDYAESWEIVDHGEDQSRVKYGPLRGQSLHQLFVEHGADFFGKDYQSWLQQPRPTQLQHRFPLLFKFLDCNRNLSVQIHPNDAQGQALSPPDLGKTEAWVVLDAEPGSQIYAGLKSGVGREELRQAVAQGETESVLHAFEPQVGDCVFIPAGTVHALGAGLLIGEIQQASDTTFRLFDWNRVDASGAARPLHVEQSLNVLRSDAGPVQPVEPITLDGSREELVTCDYFSMNRVQLTGRGELGGDDRFRILAVVAGEVTVKDDPSMTPLRRGETMLAPASCGKLQLATGPQPCSLLEITLPSPQAS